jgi:5-methyltetrahydrofolate--homocysteine methyltransferase
MYYKDDWPEAKQRLEAFWNGEMLDRACVGVLAPRRTSKLPKFPHLTHGPWLGGLEKFSDDDREAIEKWWCDPEQNYQRLKLWFENTYFGGEAVPATYINWGASAGCTFWGAEPDFSTKSVWFHKVINDWDTWEWEFDPESNKYWQIILDIMKVLIERNNEEYFIGVPEIGNAADNLSLIRSASDLAMDTIMNREEVKNAVEAMSDAWIKTHRVLHDMSRDANQGGGVLAWLNLWAPGSHDQIANDFSSMLSTDTFREFFFPELIKMGRWLDYTTFHLDGPQCIQLHVDALLELEEIDCIQFTPGAGALPTSTPEYIPIFRKIQEAGKNLYLLAEPPEIEYILDNLSARGLFLNTYANTQQEALDIIKLVHKRSKLRS